MATLHRNVSFQNMDEWKYSSRSEKLLQNFIEKCNSKTEKPDNIWSKVIYDSTDEPTEKKNIQPEIETKEDEPIVSEENAVVQEDNNKYEEIVEIVSEQYKTSGPENVSYMEEILQKDDSERILERIAESVDMKYCFENICSAFLESDNAIIERTIETFCSHLILLVLKTSDYSREIENGLYRFVDNYPRPSTEFIFVPLLNDPEKSPYLNLSRMKPAFKTDMFRTFLTNAQHPTPEWTVRLLSNAFKSFYSKDCLPNVLNYLSASSDELRKSIHFGKLIHMTCQKMIQPGVDEDSQRLMFSILDSNETCFKEVCIKLLRK